MLEVSRIVRRRARIYNFVSLNLSLNGSLLSPFLTPLTLQILCSCSLFLILLGVLFYILPVYLDCAPCAFNKFALLIKKAS
jgi:hypothetical protein